MPDYKKMYLRLFNAVTDSITLLQRAQQETEELYLDSEKADITVLQNSANDIKEV